MLNLDRVRALCAVADEGSIAAAADVLHVTASGVSQQLARLERETGAQLLARRGRGVRLTPAGELLARRGRDLLSAADRAVAELAGLEGRIAGRLRLGSFVAASRTVMPTVVAGLRAAHTDLEVTVAEGESEQLVPALMQRRLDLIVVDSWDQAPLAMPGGARTSDLHIDRADVALPADDPRAARPEVRLADLGDLRWAGWAHGTVFHDWLVRALRAAGVDPHVDYAIADFGAHLEYVRRGLAAALIPRLADQPIPSGVTLVPTVPALRRRVLAMWRADDDRPAIRAGADALAAAFADR